ncbi:MAG: transcription elongation factor GreA [Clostridia bacterium]|nr:transcription elongation factor GreA [Clostridia bacterium]
MSNELRVTNEGLQKLQDELKYLKEVKRQEVVAAIALALSYGDLSENSEYDEAKAEQGKVESRIHEHEEILKTVIDIDDSEIQTDVVNIGAIVTVFNKTAGREIEYTIVGATEANPLKGKISDRSPIGKAIMGKKTGDTVEVETPAGVITVDILNIRK